MVPGKELRAEILTSCTWRNRLPDEVVSSLRKEVCEHRLNGHVSGREATEYVPDVEGRFMEPHQRAALHGISSRDGKYMGLALSPPSPVPLMVDITSSSGVSLNPNATRETSLEPPLLIEGGSQDKSIHLSCMNPVLSL